MALLFAVAGCGVDGNMMKPCAAGLGPTATDAGFERKSEMGRKTDKKKPKYWRDVFGPDEVIQRVRPTEFRGYVPNPHRGTTTFQRFNGDPLYPDMWWNDRVAPTEFKKPAGSLKNKKYPDTTMSYCRWVWAVIEPEKGKYRWDIIDGALKAAQERGQTLQVRVQPYIADEDVPRFYWEMGGTPLRKRGRRKEIDHNNPAYIKHWGDLIRAFGKRYDGHPDLESFDIAYGGACGETGGNCTRETAEKLVDIYLASFRKTQLLSMLGTHGSAYAAGKRPGEIGWRADCLGDMRDSGMGVVPDNKNWRHMHDAYPKEVVECGLRDAWKTAPVTLETCWTVPYWHKQGWDVDWILEQALRYHISVFMPKSCYIPDEWKDKIAEWDNRIGYRFVLHQLTLPLEAKPGQRIEILVFLDNIGCAPIYRPYKFAYRFRQGKKAEIVHSKQDIGTWMPHEQTWFRDKIIFPESLKPGVAEMDVGIVDPETNVPKVRFAIKEVDDEGWHPMTSMDVLEK